jgi:hypothetical protein
MPAVEKRGVLEDVLAILDRTPGVTVEKVISRPYLVLVHENADQSIGTIQVDSASSNPAAAVDAPVNANAPACVLSACSSSSAGQQSGPAEASSHGSAPLHGTLPSDRLRHRHRVPDRGAIRRRLSTQQKEDQQS